MLSFFPRDVLDEILNLNESVSEGFPTYSYVGLTFRVVKHVVTRAKARKNKKTGNIKL